MPSRSDRPSRIQQAIASLRKRTIELRLLDEAGQPISDAFVSVEQISHEFDFSCPLRPREAFAADFDHAWYLERHAALFRPAPAADPNASWITIEADGDRRPSLAALAVQLDRHAATESVLKVYIYGPPSDGRSAIAWNRRMRWTQREQADFLGELYTVCFSRPMVKEIRLASFTDRESRSGASGLLDGGLHTKRAYKLLRNLLHSEWRTQLHGTTDGDATFAFGGFRGGYKLIARRRDGGFRRGRFELMTNTDPEIVVGLEPT